MTGGLPRGYPRGVAIRECTDADFPTITALTNRVIATTAIHFGYDPLADDELAALWSTQRATFPWLAMTDQAGDLLGYAKAGPWRARAAYRWTCETTIYLAETARGQGHGVALYTALLEACRARGFHSAIGGITLPNPASVALHEKLGFVPVGVVREAGTKFGAWHDVGFWQRML
jgi:phosphinothricin acetyltransferase